MAKLTTSLSTQRIQDLISKNPKVADEYIAKVWELKREQIKGYFWRQSEYDKFLSELTNADVRKKIKGLAAIDKSKNAIDFGALVQE